MTEQSERSTDLGWAILELMGHRKLAGYVSEQQVAGAGLLRLDVFPGDAAECAATQLYSSQAIYCITPTTEQTARAFAAHKVPQPVSRWELPAPEHEPDVADAELADDIPGF